MQENFDTYFSWERIVKKIIYVGVAKRSTASVSKTDERNSPRGFESYRLCKGHGRVKRYIPRCSEAIYGAYGGANSPNCLTATHLAQAEAARKRHLYIGRFRKRSPLSLMGKNCPPTITQRDYSLDYEWRVCNCGTLT